LSFSVGMSSSGQELDYIKDIELYYETKRSIRGGAVYFTKRYTKANIPVKKDYNPGLV